MNKKVYLCDIEALKKENEDLKADYGSIAQVERDILQDRIDKTIEYINNLYDDEYISYGNKEELLNILRGEDNVER